MILLLAIQQQCLAKSKNSTVHLALFKTAVSDMHGARGMDIECLDVA